MKLRIKRLLSGSAQFFRTRKVAIIVLLSVLGVVTAIHAAVFVSKDGHATVYLNSTELTGSGAQEVTESLAQELNTLTISAHRQNITRDIAVLGVTLDESSYEPEIQNAWNWERFVPIWGTKKLLEDKTLFPRYDIDEDQLFDAAVKLAGELQVDPVNASLTLDEEEVVVTDDVDGARYSAETVIVALKSHFSIGVASGELQIVGDRVPPSVTQEVLAAVAERYKDIAGKELSIDIDGQQFTLNPDQLTSLIDIDATDIALNRTSVEELVVAWSESVAITPGVTRVTYVDDVVTERIDGVVGQFIDIENVIKVLETWMRDPEASQVTIAVTVVQPEVIEERSYTSSSAGLENMIREWARGRAGEYWVSVVELGGRNRSASYDASSPVLMASTYKVFLSTVAYRMIENNELSASTIIDAGKNVEQCIQGGIVNSENTCMIALGWHIGWDKADSVLASLGYSSVRLNNYNPDSSFDGDKTAPASAQTKLLSQLENGSLLNSAHTSSLLGYMKSQIYRDGIPAGVSGSLVANKVGFLFDYLHDIAIVYGPNSTYAVAILSENASWSAVADLSSEIHTFLNN